MLNKPDGVVSASRDKHEHNRSRPGGRRLPAAAALPCGRLDKTSTGFVLLTDDGAFAHALTAPGRHVAKTYLVTLDTPLTEAMREGFAAGVTLADGQTLAPALVEPIDSDACRARVVLRQGVYHQIKRMFGVYGAGVNALHPLRDRPGCARRNPRPRRMAAPDRGRTRRIAGGGARVGSGHARPLQSQRLHPRPRGAPRCLCPFFSNGSPLSR